MTDKTWNVLVTGGAGYVGAVLVPKLLEAGHGVTVLDLYMYGDDVLKQVADHLFSVGMFGFFKISLLF